MAGCRSIGPIGRRRIASGLQLAALGAACACVPAQPRNELRPQPAVQAATADPAKLMTSRPNVAITDVRISAVLRVENGCLVIGIDEVRTVVWPAGTILSPDRRAVIVPGAYRPISIGDRFVAAGGTVRLSSPPSTSQATAIANGCPGTLTLIGEIAFEE